MEFFYGIITAFVFFLDTLVTSHLPGLNSGDSKFDSHSSYYSSTIFSRLCKSFCKVSGSDGDLLSDGLLCRLHIIEFWFQGVVHFIYIDNTLLQTLVGLLA